MFVLCGAKLRDPRHNGSESNFKRRSNRLSGCDTLRDFSRLSPTMASAYLSTRPTRLTSTSSTLRQVVHSYTNKHLPSRPMFFHSGLFSSSAHHHAPPRDPEFRVVTKQTLNKHVLEAQYAVRGAIPLRAEELREQLENGEGKDLPFDAVVSCNIGNPQQLDQKPLTFLRQVSFQPLSFPLAVLALRFSIPLRISQECGVKKSGGGSVLLPSPTAVADSSLPSVVDRSSH